MAWTGLLFTFGSLLTATKMTQLQDNFQAMARGEAGAPPLWTSALWNGAYANSSHMSNLSAATSIPESADAAASLINNANVQLLQLTSNSVTDGWVVNRGGRYACRVTHWRRSGSPLLVLQAYRNGIAWSDPSTYGDSGFSGWSPFYVDSLSPGDTLQMYGRMTAAGSFVVQFQWFEDTALALPLQGGG